VFNFFSPFYAPTGEIANAIPSLVAPELQLATEFLNTTLTNFFWTQAFSRTNAQTNTADIVVINVQEEIGLAADSEALINRVARRLLGGADQISSTLKTQAKTQIERSAATDTRNRVADAIYLVASAPEYSIQK
jgi:Na+-transporting NADH:ubiquinone oxidoreductase subunit NqrA